MIADLVGKAQHVRTAPIPTWVKHALDEWTVAAGITQGVLFRAINKAGRVWGGGMSPKVLWDVVRAAAAAPTSTSWPRTIFGARARDSVI